MKALLPFVIVGLATGSLYGLAGLGLVLTYRASGVFNFGHGAIAAAAAFVFYSLHVTHGVSWPLAAFSTIAIFGVVVGLILDWLTRTLGTASEVAVIVFTIGIILAVQGILFLTYGNITRYFPAFLPQSGFDIVGVNVSWDQFFSAIVALCGAIGLQAFLRLTRTGICMRAIVDNPTLVSLTGQRPANVTRAAWAIGCSFAALSGILLAPTLGLDATLLTLLVVQSFGACAIGAFKSLPLTYAGGLIVGVTASLATKYLTHRPWTGLPSAVPLLILVVVLIVLPSDRLPRARGSLRSLRRERHWSIRTTALVAGVATVAAVTIPFAVGNRLPLWIGGLVYVILFGSLSLLVWTSGQMSLCQLAFAALGATTLAHLVDSGVPWLLALLLAGLITVPVGALVAIPAVRVSGIYLALVTLGFGILMQNVLYQTNFMFGAAVQVAVDRPRLGFIDGSNDRWFYAIVVVIAAITCVCLAAIQRGQLGRLLRAMAESPTLLSTNGLNVNVTKLIVFCLSAFFAAIAGGLMITQYGAVNGNQFSPLQSLILLGVLGICGTRLLRSSFNAAVAVAVLPGYVPFLSEDRRLLVFGLTAVGAGVVLANMTVLANWFARSAAETEARRAYGPIANRMSRPRPAAVGALHPDSLANGPDGRVERASLR